jgi:hypothetical protein
MNANYVVMGVTLVVWLGLWWFMMKVNGRIKKLERDRS